MVSGHFRFHLERDDCYDACIYSRELSIFYFFVTLLVRLSVASRALAVIWWCAPRYLRFFNLAAVKDVRTAVNFYVAPLIFDSYCCPASARYIRNSWEIWWLNIGRLERQAGESIYVGKKRERRRRRRRVVSKKKVDAEGKRSFQCRTWSYPNTTCHSSVWCPPPNCGKYGDGRFHVK